MKRIINEDSLEHLPKDGSQSMTGNLSMSNNRINSLAIGVKDVLPVTNVGYVNQAKADFITFQ